VTELVCDLDTTPGEPGQKELEAVLEKHRDLTVHSYQYEETGQHDSREDEGGPIVQANGAHTTRVSHRVRGRSTGVNCGVLTGAPRGEGWRRRGWALRAAPRGGAGRWGRRAEGAAEGQ
jgi:hypothetical protein